MQTYHSTMMIKSKIHYYALFPNGYRCLNHITMWTIKHENGHSWETENNTAQRSGLVHIAYCIVYPVIVSRVKQRDFKIDTYIHSRQILSIYVRCNGSNVQVTLDLASVTGFGFFPFYGIFLVHFTIRVKLLSIESMAAMTTIFKYDPVQGNYYFRIIDRNSSTKDTEQTLKLIWKY